VHGIQQRVVGEKFYENYDVHFYCLINVLYKALETLFHVRGLLLKAIVNLNSVMNTDYFEIASLKFNFKIHLNLLFEFD
jgi:hypothetical protein